LAEFIVSPDHTRWLAQRLPHYDLLEIHATFSYVCTAAGYVARRQKRPYILCPHGQFSPWVAQQKPLKKKIYRTLFEEANFRHLSAVHCTTTAESQNVRAVGITAPTFIIPLGVTLHPPITNAQQQLRDTYHIPPERTILLFLARFHPKKRPDFLIEVLKHLDQNKFHLILAGDGEPEYRQFLEHSIVAAGLQDRVTLPGFLMGTAKALALYGSDAFVLPSYGENFGIAVAEAMAVGLPVVITPDVEIAEEIRAADAGWVIPGTTAAWIDALEEVLTQPERRHNRGQNAQHLAQIRYHWDVIGEALVREYDRVLQRVQG
jgi:glycosyltransferase involved in cell wall biosynthesis